MSARSSLQISPTAPDARLTTEQERFNSLVGQIEKARKTRVEREAGILKFRQDYAGKLQPLRASLSAVCRESAFALDRLLDLQGWSRAERATLAEMLCETAEALLEGHQEDVELKALFDKHSSVAFDTVKQEELQHLKAEAEEITGLNLGDDAVSTEEDLIQRVYEEMAAREAAAQARKDAKAQRRQSAAQKRSAADAQVARQSLREIYRKLASAVHPDREPDPERRETKNALMQKINQAYAANDLLTLFETQMQIEQTDAGAISQLSMQRLMQYNKLLAEQLADVKRALRDMEAGFCMDHGLQPGSGFTAKRLDQLIQGEARRVRAQVSQQQQFLDMLADKATIRRWLRQQRRYARERDYFDDDLF